MNDLEPQLSEPKAQLSGKVRLGKRTKELTKRLKAQEIALIDHEDIDRVAAEALVKQQPLAVINVAHSISGRYPNAGPQILVEANIPLIDVLEPELFARLKDGSELTIAENVIYNEQGLKLNGKLHTISSVHKDMLKARENLGQQLESFAANTLNYMLEERELLIDGVGTPEVKTDFQDRPTLIVVRGYNYLEDLSTLQSFIRENRPVIIGVDGGADAVLDAGLKLDMIIGDMDSVSDEALRSGAELVVHAYKNGKAPGLARLKELGLAKDAVIFSAAGTSEDIAMLLADDKGADVIVAVGTHGTLEEFLDKGRAGMSSTFLTRLRVGSKLVDAKGVSRLYRQRISSAQLSVLLIAGFIALLAALAATSGGQTLIQITGARLDDLLSWFTNLFIGRI